jgi:carbonic anhydrase
MPPPPARRLAVVTCMDARILPTDILDLQAGDAHVLRNAGGLVTDDVLRSLVISQTALNTDSIHVIHHTDCGVRDDAEVEGSVRDAVAAIRGHEALPHRDKVRGFVLDLARDGALRELEV